MLVYRPGKFVIEFPCHHRHKHGSDSNETRNCYEERPDRSPDVEIDLIVSTEIDDRSLDLVHLHCGVYE